jgi:hypothetical protein
VCGAGPSGRGCRIQVKHATHHDVAEQVARILAREPDVKAISAIS